jgi:SnoaL-like domain
MNLQYALDHLAILNRYAAYTYAVDAADLAGFLDCFTPDGYTDVSSFTTARRTAPEAFRKMAGDDGVIRGHANLAKTVGFVRMHHLTANILVKSIDGDRATGSAYFVVFSPDEGKIEHYGRYEDELRRCADGQWRFASRIDIALYEREHVLPVANG